MAAKFKIGQIVEVRGNVCAFAHGERAKVVAIMSDTAYRVASLIHLQDQAAVEDDLCEPRWTELERARKYLQENQRKLQAERKRVAMLLSIGVISRAEMEDNLIPFEDSVSAALSWVWDAQERDRIVNSSKHIAPDNESLEDSSKFSVGERARLIKACRAIVPDRIGCSVGILTEPDPNGLFKIQFEDGAMFWASPDMLERIVQ